MMRYIFRLLCATLIICSSAYADEFRKEQGIISAFEKGDDYALSSEIIKFMEKNPSTPETALYLHDLLNSSDILGFEKVREELLKIAEYKSGNVIGEVVRRKAYEYLSDIEYRMRYSDKNRFVEIYRPVSKWYISTLFKRYGRGDILYDFGEESSPRPDKAVKNAYVEPDGSLNPGKWLSGETGVVYAHSLIDIPDNANLRVESDGEYILFFNGIKAAENLYGDTIRAARLFRCNGKGASVITIKTFVRGTSFRLTLEDQGGRPIRPVELSRENTYGNSTITEIDDHILSELKSRPDSAEKEFYLAMYFSECGSDESFAHYEKASRSGQMMISILNAWEYIRRGAGDDRESLLVEGFSRIEELYQKKPGLVYVNTIQLQKKIMTVEPEKVLSFINDIKKRSEADYGFALRESSFLLEYQPDIAEIVIDQYIKKYPNSLSLKLLRAERLLKTDNSQGRKELEQIGSVSRTDKIVELIANDMRVNGEYSVIIDMENPRQDDSLISIKAEAMISCGRTDDAKKILIKALSRRNNPDWLVLLGDIEVRNGRDPDLYWGKCSILYPERSFPKDQIRFMNGEEHSQLRGLVNSSEIDEWIKRYKSGEVFDAAVICRNYVTKIEYNRTARFYCEELIYLRNDEDIGKYAEYRIPFRHGVSIVNAKTYNRKGEIVSSSRINEVNSCKYLSIEGAVKDSLIHISYEAGLYNVLLPGSAVIETGTVYLDDNNEHVRSVHAIISIEKSVNAEIHHSGNLKPEKVSEDGYNITRLDASNIPVVKEEDYPPDARSELLWYSVSSMKNQYDIVSWYRGVIQGKIPKVISEVNHGTERLETIRSVCRGINKLMRSSEDDMRYVRSAEDVIHSGFATNHEKVIAAVAMLREKGLIAYPCVAADRFYPAADGEFTIERFNIPLVYVPGDAKETGIWLDLSVPEMPAGCVRSEIENTDAIVVADNSAFIRKVYSLIPSSEDIEMHITIGSVSSGYKMKTLFRGEAGRISILFKGEDSEKYGMAYAGQFSSDEDIASIKSSVTEKDEFELDLSGEMRDVSVDSPKSLYITPFRKSGRIQDYARSRVRQSPLLIRERNVINENYEYILPESVAQSELNYSESFSREGITISYSVLKRKGELKMVAKRKTVISPVLIDISQYGDFIDFVNKCSASDNLKFRLEKK